jgi:hypothetical protein
VAKGQLRSNKEVRKPKKDKGVTKTTNVEGSQVKLAGSTHAGGKKS